MRSNLVMENCPVKIRKHAQHKYLIVLPIKSYDIILGIDWLMKYNARID